MSIHKLQQDILRCKHIISEISIKHYSNDQNTYIEIVNKIFQEIFKDYFECPDKIEPQSDHLPKESLKKIRDTLRINNN